MGERAPKGAEDESAAQEEQNDTGRGGDQEESVEKTGATITSAAKFALALPSIGCTQIGRVLSAAYSKV